MSIINDGGAAFPLYVPETPNAELIRQGMSLRDWFAGQALAGILAGGKASSFKMFASDAYTAADAMLAAREVPQ